MRLGRAIDCSTEQPSINLLNLVIDSISIRPSFFCILHVHTHETRSWAEFVSLLAPCHVRAAPVLGALPLTALAGNGRRFRDPATSGGQKDASWENEAGFFAMFGMTPNT